MNANGMRSLSKHKLLLTTAFVLTACGEHGIVGGGTGGISHVKWKFSSGAPIYYSSPAVAPDGTIYFGNGAAFSTASRALHALNADGTLKWRFPIAAYIYTPTVGADGTVYVQDANASVYAVTTSGSLKWSYPLSAPSASDEGQLTPAIDATGTIYIGGDGVYALNANGAIKWRYPATGNTLQIRSSPAIALDGTIILGVNTNLGPNPAVLWALNPDGTLKWQSALADAPTAAKGLWVYTFSSPAIAADGSIYIGAETESAGTNGFVFAVNPDGSAKWEYVISGYRPVRSCLLYTSPSPRDRQKSRMPSSA